MLKRGLLFFTVLFFCVQSLLPAQYNAGLHGGLNLASMDRVGLFGGDQNSYFRTTFNAGIFGEYKLSSYFSLRAEVNYSRRGETNDSFTFIDERDYFSYDELTDKLDFIEIPLLLNYYPAPDKQGLKGKLFCGTVISFLAGAETELYFNGETLGKYNTAHFYKSYEFGLAIGVAGVYPLGEGNLEFGFRYLQGLTDITETPGDSYTSLISFNAGYGFTLGK